MDPLDATRRLFAAIDEGDDPARFADDQAVGAAEEVRRRRAAWQGHRLRLLDAVMKRNLVFASYAWTEPGGRDVATGTWVLSFDRDGTVIAWTEMP